MDFLNKAYAQLVDLFRSMTPGARLSAALLLVVAVVSVAYLFNEQVAGQDAYLMGGEMFSASQLADMEAALGKANLEARREGARLKIPRGQESKYMAALAEAGALPADFGDYLHRAVNTNSWFSSKSQQEALAKSAKQRDMQLIINNMHGVERSAVLIAEDVRQGLHTRKFVTASVSLWSKGNQPLESSLISSVRDLVAASVNGLKREAVTIIDSKNGRSYPGTFSDDKRSSSMMGDYADVKQRMEHDYQAKILNQLSHIPNVIVGVNAELDAELANEITSTEFDSKAVVFDSSESTMTRTVDSGSTGGRVGVSAQGGVANQAATVSTAAGMKNNEETAQTEQRKAVPTTHQHIVKEGRRPTLVTASVTVPSTYYEEIWRKQNPPVEGQPEKKPDATAIGDLQMAEKKRIEDTVLPLLPIRDRTADAYPQVTVSTYYPISAPSLADPTLQDSAMAWLGQYWSTLGMMMLGLVSLVMLRSMVRSVPVVAAATIAADMPEMQYEFTPPAPLAFESNSPEPLPENSARNRLKRRTPGGPSLRDELSDIVREDPEAAVSILRTWIGNAS